MTNTALPINASSGTPAYTSQQFRQAFSALISNDSTRPVGSRSGYGPGHQPTVLTATSTVWTIGPFSCIIDPAFTTTQGPYFVSTDANSTGSVTAAAGSARIDILYAQVNDTDIDSSGLRSVTVNYLAGTAGSGVPPTTPARSFVLATISVPASGGGSPTITVNSTFSVGSGGILPTSASAAYPGTPTVGQYVDDAALGGLLRWSGSAWAAVTTDSGWQTLPLTSPWGATVVTPQYRKVGNRVWMRGQAVNGATASAYATFPAGFRPAFQVTLPAVSSTTPYAAGLVIATSGVASIFFQSTSPTVSIDGLSFPLD